LGYRKVGYKGNGAVGFVRYCFGTFMCFTLQPEARTFLLFLVALFVIWALVYDFTAASLI
jgi:fucose permease